MAIWPSHPGRPNTSLRQSLAARAAEWWPQFADVTVSWHGQFAYVSGAYLSDHTACFSQPPLRINGRTHW